MSSKADSKTKERFTEVDWGWGQCIHSHHAQTSSGKGQQLLNSKYQATPEPETSEATYLGLEEK